MVSLVSVHAGHTLTGVVDQDDGRLGVSTSHEISRLTDLLARMAHATNVAPLPDRTNEGACSRFYSTQFCCNFGFVELLSRIYSKLRFYSVSTNIPVDSVNINHDFPCSLDSSEGVVGTLRDW